MRIAFLILAFCLSACATAKEVASVETGPRYGGGDATVGQEYLLDVGDKVRVTVFREETLSGEFQVNPSGNISLPLIGAVQVGGHTTLAVEDAIRTRLADGYVNDPRVNVELITLRPYYILGEVGTPGKYEYASGLTAMNAIATAGGFTNRSEKRVLYIREAGAEGERRYELTADLRVRPGDTLRVGERLF